MLGTRHCPDSLSSLCSLFDLETKTEQTFPETENEEEGGVLSQNFMRLLQVVSPQLLWGFAAGGAATIGIELEMGPSPLAGFSASVCN